MWRCIVKVEHLIYIITWRQQIEFTWRRQTHTTVPFVSSLGESIENDPRKPDNRSRVDVELDLLKACNRRFVRNKSININPVVE